MNDMQSKDPDALSGTRKIWLLLLLIVLVVVLVIYDQGAANQYGEKAYAKATTLTEKVTHWAKQIYACGLPGCKPEKTAQPNVTVATASAEPNQNSNPNFNSTTPASQDTQGPSTFTSAPSTGGVEQNPPVATAEMPLTGERNTPTQSAYPAYPPYSSFGAGNSGISSAPTGETTVPATPPANLAPPPPDLAPATPPPAIKPAPAATQAAVPDYPAYPVASNYPPIASAATPSTPPAAQAAPVRPTPELLPVPRVIRPDQRANQAPHQAPRRDMNEALATARKSALAGRPGEAIHEYLQYLTSNPHDINAYGELGNVYMKIGRYQEAAQNYYEAATRLIDARQINAVVALMPIIQMHEPMLANLLNQKIAHTREGERGYSR